MTWTLSQSFDFQGQDVRYDVRGEGAPLVLVHGTPWSSFNWRHLIPRLAESWQVYFFDLLGYGQSEKRDGQDVSLGVQNEVLARLLEHWELNSPTIIGHDFGGATVLRSHLLNGCDYEKIVLVDAVALAPWGSPFFAHVKEHEVAFQGVPDYIHEAIVTAYVKRCDAHADARRNLAGHPLSLARRGRSQSVLPTNRAGVAALYRRGRATVRRYSSTRAGCLGKGR